jgi:hypothetical protein
MNTALPMRWDGESLTPINQHWAKQADRAYTVGEIYRVETIENRSAASHKHFFAQVRDAWLNLPPHLSEQFDSPEKLRKYALIKAGYCDERVLPCGSESEAKKVATFIAPLDDFAVVLTTGDVVRVYTAKSQSTRAMGKDAFQASKTAVLEIVSGMIGVKPDELGRAA